MEVSTKEAGTEDPGSSILVEETESPALMGGELGMGVEVGAGENYVFGRCDCMPIVSGQGRHGGGLWPAGGDSVQVAVLEEETRNSFGILQSLSDMEVQDFERIPSSSAGIARAAGKRHRRQLSDGDVPGEVVPWEQLRNFQIVLHHRLTDGPVDTGGPRRGAVQGDAQHQSLESGRRGVRQKGGRAAKSLLNQVPLQSQTHYSLRSNVKSH